MQCPLYHSVSDLNVYSFHLLFMCLFKFLEQTVQRKNSFIPALMSKPHTPMYVCPWWVCLFVWTAVLWAWLWIKQRKGSGRNDPFMCSLLLVCNLGLHIHLPTVISYITVSVCTRLSVWFKKAERYIYAYMWWAAQQCVFCGLDWVNYFWMRFLNE